MIDTRAGIFLAVSTILVGCVTANSAKQANNTEHCSVGCQQYEKLASQGDVQAEDQLANMYLTGNGVDENYKKAAEWFTAAANAGNADAEYHLGSLTAEGLAVPPNYAQAMDWYRKAVDQGFAKAYAGIGDLYVSGQGVPKDTQQAMEWYKKGADHGDTTAMTDVGIMYYQGKLVPQDYAEANRWFKKAADAGFPYAEAWLGEMELYGRGVPQDPAGAMQLFLKAADGKEISACLYLAKLYAHGGPGIDVDIKKSDAYFARAADHEMVSFFQMSIELRAIVDAHKYYPRAALDEHAQGATTMEFDLAGDEAVNIKIAESSGNDILDEAAAKAVSESLFPRRAQPLQAMTHFSVRLNFTDTLDVPHPGPAQ